MLMQNFGVTNKEYYGMLWYFLEWSIKNPFLTYFDCSELFAIFMGEKLVGPRCANSKQKEAKPPVEIGVI